MGPRFTNAEKIAVAKRWRESGQTQKIWMASQGVSKNILHVGVRLLKAHESGEGVEPRSEENYTRGEVVRLKKLLQETTNESVELQRVFYEAQASWESSAEGFKGQIYDLKAENASNVAAATANLRKASDTAIELQAANQELREMFTQAELRAHSAEQREKALVNALVAIGRILP